MLTKKKEWSPHLIYHVHVIEIKEKKFETQQGINIFMNFTKICLIISDKNLLRFD